MLVETVTGFCFTIALLQMIARCGVLCLSEAKCEQQSMVHSLFVFTVEHSIIMSILTAMKIFLIQGIFFIY